MTDEDKKRSRELAEQISLRRADGFAVDLAQYYLALLAEVEATKQELLIKWRHKNARTFVTGISRYQSFINADYQASIWRILYPANLYYIEWEFTEP